MEESPLISVIIPVYNVENYVEKCLDSVRRQSYSNLEIIVVDDGATDRSGEICERISKEDDRIKVFHKQNGGLSSARNYGIKKARGEWVCFVDSDDYIRRNFVEKLYEAVNKNGADVAVCGYDSEKPQQEVVSGKEATVRLLVQQGNMEIIAWNKIYKKGLFLDNEIWFPEGMNYEDCLTTYKVLSFSNRVAYVSESLYVYVERDNSITNSDEKEKKLLIRKKAAEEAILYFEDKKDLLEAAKVSLLSAEYAFLDFAIAGRIDEKYKKKSLAWLKKNVGLYKGNKYLTGKLKLYNILSTKCGGVLYILFRKIRHE